MRNSGTEKINASRYPVPAVPIHRVHINKCQQTHAGNLFTPVIAWEYLKWRPPRPVKLKIPQRSVFVFVACAEDKHINKVII